MRQLCRNNFYFAYQGLNDPELQKAIARFHLAACPALCPQSLFKFHPDFDAALAAILHEDSRARIVMLAGNHPHWMNLLQA